jgi:hypothetical protein
MRMSGSDGARGAAVTWPEPLLTAAEAVALAEYVRAQDPWYQARVREVALGAGCEPVFGVVLMNRATGRELPAFYHSGDYSRHMGAMPWWYGEDQRSAFAAWGGWRPIA